MTIEDLITCAKYALELNERQEERLRGLCEYVESQKVEAARTVERHAATALPEVHARSRAKRRKPATAGQ
jgi:hypothetical protein